MIAPRTVQNTGSPGNDPGMKALIGPQSPYYLQELRKDAGGGEPWRRRQLIAQSLQLISNLHRPQKRNAGRIGGLILH